MARPSARAVGCGQGPLQRGGRLRPAHKGSNRPRARSIAAWRQRPACKGQPLAANLQGAALVAKAVASRGNATDRRGDYGGAVRPLFFAFIVEPACL
ncbi:hypothetical protein BHE74_00042291 [Ensete ventricosum]|nr:hypothetical protein GW17_00017108 [Ensete ventricosum]RWW51368.1 hypothetical protein BHE74_00042291 [Ensete ventricosum]RZR92577.1 hypothetical protein BHM03_00020889 [Ensete ventricosum]